ncbi:N-acetylmuramoyl-L-alanine amidase [Nonomuraea zeae]|uniref:N-acetylmuramoyl-L-alanine amidase n=1 Tax=Nonomuraea zeae TaxID=1642303 RepID=A0A5S4FWI2_9ACTN|nr:peptidoglycan recognition family protein [Nonomuraea zeae]TMR15320.1 N-acetylmuramoyl-L-alanine amidase [Nonomuraea zeae]
MTTMPQAFAQAARRHGVPESILLAVSYLESRWDCNGGRPSTGAGFGPMHLTDGPAMSMSRRHHLDGEEDLRGDDSRPPPHPTVPAHNGFSASLHTLERAAELTGESLERLREDPAANIDGGAALLADYQQALGAPPSADPADWYGAVARYSGASAEEVAAGFADEVYEVIHEGAARMTDTGARVTLPPAPEVHPSRSWLAGLDLPHLARADAVEAPAEICCEWVPAPYKRVPDGKYGNHDIADRPGGPAIRYIVIHDTEESFDTTLSLVQDPARFSWHYSLRSSDGHLAQHLLTKDVAWHAGNSYFNSTSIGLEHEGFLAAGGLWYTEAMYRTSAKLVRHLAGKFGIPLDRAHIVGHDNVPGLTPERVPKMHEDPGPYWDWAHFFDLMGAPLCPDGDAGTATVMILPDYDRNRPHYIGCDDEHPEATCPPHGSASVWLHTAPRGESPLVKDIGKHATGESSYSVYDHSARASTGQRYVVAERRGDWTAIWYLGQKAWFHNPESDPVAVPSRTRIATPRPGLKKIPVYGRPQPEAAAYPPDVEVQPLVPLQYELPAGQSYTVGLTTTGEFFKATTFDPTLHRVVRGTQEYHQIQFGHRLMFVRSEDVVVTET